MSGGAVRSRGWPRAFWAVTVFLGLALALVLGGCGGSDDINRIHGTRLTIYAGVPLVGASSADGHALINGARMALDAIAGRIGHYRITLRVLNDATLKSKGWNPAQTEINARLAAADKTTIGYLGDMNSGASAVSIPLLNRADIAQVSPTSTAVGLTTDAPGASPGEPDKYYPTGVRTFARVIPNDAIQAQVQVQLQQSLGCTRTYAVNDGEVDGLETALTFVAAAKSAGLKVVGLQQYEPGQADYSSFASSVASAKPNCVLISALPQDNAGLVTRQVAAALPDARIFCTGAVAESVYTDPSDGGIPVTLDPRVMITVATLAPVLYPPAGRQFLAEYTRRYGTPAPYAIFGYEAMSLLLSSIDRATDHGRKPARRSKVVAALFATHDRPGALGTYSIQPDGNTTLDRYGVWRLVDGRLVFWKALTG